MELRNAYGLFATSPFSLNQFRADVQDIRDLVELTVGKMEMYHLVAALFMESSMALLLGSNIAQCRLK